LIPLNLASAAAMLLAVSFGTPPVSLVAFPMMIIIEASIVAVFFSPGRQSRLK
jgi:hypothetical protein